MKIVAFAILLIFAAGDMSLEEFAKMKAEIYARGPISCGIDAAPILDYQGGIAKDRGMSIDHVISVVGWGHDDDEGPYWIVRRARTRPAHTPPARPGVAPHPSGPRHPQVPSPTLPRPCIPGFPVVAPHP